MMVRLVGALVVCCGLVTLIGCGGGGGNKSKGGGKSFEVQIAEAKSMSDPAKKVRRLTEIADKQFEAQDSYGGGNTLKEAYLAADKIDDLKNRARALTEVAKVQAKANKKSDARRTLNDAVEAISKLDEPRSQVEFYSTVATAQNDIGETSDAAKTLEKAAEIAGKIESVQDRVFSLVDVGTSYAAIDNLQAGKEVRDTAMAAAEEAGDPSLKAYCVAAVGRLEYKLGMKEEATATFEKSQEILKQVEAADARLYRLVEIAEEMYKAGLKKSGADLIDEAISQARKTITDGRTQQNFIDTAVQRKQELQGN